MRIALRLYVFTLFLAAQAPLEGQEDVAVVSRAPDVVAAVVPVTAAESSSLDSRIVETDPPAVMVEEPRQTFDWMSAGNQSFFFLGMQHGLRMVQVKTRRQLDGKFFPDYADAVSGLGGWGDGDSVLTNYIGHPMMGAISGFIQIQNDPKGIGLEFDSRKGDYWRSRMKAFGWAALYSTQFELGPVSEASIGNVGRTRGTMGFVDLVMTPVGGLGWIVAEDAMDKHWVKRLEAGRSDGMKRLLRMSLNPNRSLANVFRLKKPWHRDTRPMDWDE